MTAIQLQRALVEDLQALFAETKYKTTTPATEAEIEVLRPPGDEEEWTEYQKRFWASVQNDYRQHHMAPLNVYAQAIPIRETASPEIPSEPEDGEDIEPVPPPQDPDAEVDPFPYIIVRLNSGELTTPDAYHNVSVLLLVGIFDDNPDNQGHATVMDIIERIQMHYLQQPSLGDFQYMDPINWVLQDEESYPYYYGAIQLHFWARAPRSEQWEDLV